MSLILNPHRFPAPAGGGPLFHDTFTPSGADVSLASVTPDTAGNGYTLISESNATGDLQRKDSTESADGIVTATLDENDLLVGYKIAPAPTSADYEIEIHVGVIDTTASTSTISVLARYSSGTGYAFEIRPGFLYITKITAVGSSTDLDYYWTAPSADDRYRFTVSGSSLTVDRKPDGGVWSEILSATDSTYTAAGDAGVGMGAWGASTRDIRTEWTIKELKVTEL